MDNKWLLYGAYGYTGNLILEEALKNEEKPDLAGRNEKKLNALAKKYGLEYISFHLNNQELIERVVSNYKLILNAAGPFKYTNKPLVDASIKSGVNYLDITGEIEIFEQNFSRQQETLNNDIVIISGVGFDVIPSDCMAAYVSKKIENPTHLELGIAGLSGYSPGTMKTMIHHLPNATAFREDGKIESRVFGKDSKKIPFWDKKRVAYLIGWGDVSTAFRTTKIPNIKTYMPLSKNLRFVTKWYGHFLLQFFKFDFLKNYAKKWITKNIQGPNEQLRNSSNSYIWAKVENEKGERYESWLKTIEAYRLTAIGAIKSVQRIFNSKLSGVLTPALAFGEDFILEFPETNRKDSL